MRILERKEGGLSNSVRNYQNVCGQSLMYYWLHVGAYIVE